MKETAVVAEEIPAIGIAYNCELPGKKGIQFQTHVPQTADVASLNAVIDKIRVAADRQFAFGMIEHLRLQLEQEEKIASDHAMRMSQVDENIKREWSTGARKGDPQLSSRQRQEQQQAYAHAEESKRRIAKVRADIAEFEAKIGA